MLRLFRALLLALLPLSLSLTRAQTIDATFNTDPNSYLTALAVQPDGKILVGGFFSRIGGLTRTNLARLNPDGSLDLPFNAVVSGYVASIVVQPDGKILIGGNISLVAGNSRGRLVRLNADGTVDTSFAPAVTGISVRAIALQPNGKLVIGGEFTSVAGQPRYNLARVNADGTLDPSLLADIVSISTTTGVFALALQPDGGVLVGGQFISVGNFPRACLARINPDGTPDAAFNPAGSASNVSAIFIQRDGKILLGGGFGSVGSAPRSNIARLLPNGLADPTFNPGASSVVRAFAEQPDGKIYVGGLFSTIGGIARTFLTRLLPDGSVDPAFTAEATGALANSNQGVTALQLADDGRLYVAGGFTAIAGRTLAGLARFNLPTPQFASSPGNTTAAAGSSITFSVTLASGTATYQWRRNGTALPGATLASLTLPTISTADAGRYDVLATNEFGSSTSLPATLAIGVAPALTVQPSATVATLGESVTLSVVATASPSPSYQWQKNGAPLPAATSASLTLAAAQLSDAGIYTCLVSNSVGRVTTNPIALTVEPANHLSNVSIRTTLAASDTLIVGYVVGGGSTEVLVRAAGPALADFGVVGTMADPRVELYRESTKLLENDNWPGVLAPTATRVGAFPFAANSRDAALVHTSTGAFSVLVTGAQPGIVLVETYDAGPVGPVRFINLSARNRVGTDSDILIAGFTLAGRGTRRLLVRAVGPTLGGVPFNLPGTLADPQLSLFDAAGRTVATNDNWDASLAATFIAAGAFALAPASRDAALLVTLPAGSYTAQVSGVANTTGVALVEVYEVP